jgi:hypothetical protein
VSLPVRRAQRGCPNGSRAQGGRLQVPQRYACTQPINVTKRTKLTSFCHPYSTETPRFLDAPCDSRRQKSTNFASPRGTPGIVDKMPWRVPITPAHRSLPTPFACPSRPLPDTPPPIPHSTFHIPNSKRASLHPNSPRVTLIIHSWGKTTKSSRDVHVTQTQSPPIPAIHDRSWRRECAACASRFTTYERVEGTRASP